MEILMLEKFEKVKGTFCLTIVLPKNVILRPIDNEEDLKKVLSNLLKGLEPGEYSFLTISLAPLAYGKVLKKRGPKKQSTV